MLEPELEKGVVSLKKRCYLWKPYFSVGYSKFYVRKLRELDADVAEEESRLNELIERFSKVISINEGEFDSSLYLEIRRMRMEYDDSVEIWHQEYTEGRFSEGEDLDHDMFGRLLLGYIFLGIEELNHEAKYSWFDRLKMKVEQADDEMKTILPTIFREFQKRGSYHSYKPRYFLSPDEFWWEKMKYDIRTGNSQTSNYG